MAYYVYLLASKKHGTLYLGVTNDIVRRGMSTEQRPPTVSRSVTAWTSWSGSRFTMMRRRPLRARRS